MKQLKMLLLASIVIFFTACGGGGGSSSSGVAAPIANAGVDQNVHTASSVTLDGSGSSDADGDFLTYAWSIINKPVGSNALLSDTTVVNPTFTTDIDGSYIVQLIVNDGTVNSGSDTIMITVVTTNLQLSSPLTGHIQIDSTIIAKVVAALQNGWGIKFILDKGNSSEEIKIVNVEPYEVIFDNISMGEHTIDAYIVDDSDIEQLGEENHDSVYRIRTGGEIIVAIGDSITKGFPDYKCNDSATIYCRDNTSEDGRNAGGGFEPILNDLLTVKKGYPHSVLNEGVLGDTSQQGLNRLPAIINSHPEATTYLIMFGTNDATWHNVPVETFRNNMQQMIDMIKNAGKIPAVAKIPRVLGDGYNGPSYEQLNMDPENGASNINIRKFNVVIDELVAANNITIVPPDFYTYFKETYEDTYSSTEQDGYADNLHPDGLGYNAMAEMWRDAL